MKERVLFYHILYIAGRISVEGGGRKVVSHLSGYRDVAVVSTHRWRSEATGSLEMSSNQEKEFWCKLWWRTQASKSVAQQNKRWARVCTSKEIGVKETVAWRDAQAWSRCHSKRYIARIDQGSVLLSRDQHKSMGNAITMNATHTFPAHLLDLNAALTTAKKKVQRFTTPIAHSFGALSVHAAHLINQIPRLVTLAQHAPETATLLVLDTRMHRQFVDLLREKDILKQEVHYVSLKAAAAPNEIIFSAPTIYFAAEAVGVDAKNLPVTELKAAEKWYTLQNEICSFQLAANRTELRVLLDRAGSNTTTKSALSEAALNYGDARTCEFEVLLVSRADAKSRQVENHLALLTTVWKAFDAPLRTTVCIRTFLGSSHNIASTERIWRRADLVIAPHGAALAFILFMRPATYVIELGYHAGRGSTRTKNHEAALGTSVGMPWPAPYYWLIALSAKVRLIASMAQGSYTGKMTANLTDISAIIHNIITPAFLSTKKAA